MNPMFRERYSPVTAAGEGKGAWHSQMEPDHYCWVVNDDLLQCAL